MARTHQIPSQVTSKQREMPVLLASGAEAMMPRRASAGQGGAGAQSLSTDAPGGRETLGGARQPWREVKRAAIYPQLLPT